MRVKSYLATFTARGLSPRTYLLHRYVEEKDASNNFSFKCHRRDQTPSAKDQSLVYSVNDISFHPVHGTFSTCGKLRLLSPLS